MSAAAKAKRGTVSLQGPRPQPLSLPADASSPPRPSKRPRVNGGDDDRVGSPAGPVIVYEHTPKVIHARPDEFKALVQRLTGQQQPVHQPATETTAAPPEEEATTTAADPLVLTPGQQAPPELHDYTPALPSHAGGGLAGFLLSPGSFLFSPSTMQALQELIS